MKHFFIIISILGTLLGGITLAAPKFGDCQIFSATGTDFTYLYGTNWTKEYGNILPEAAISKSFLHLKSYCCSLIDLQNENLQKICKEDKSNNVLAEQFPQSQYLFDHIIDIMLRRLDAQAGLLYGLDPDITGSERRTRINDVAENKDGANPLSISTTYKKYWSFKELNLPRTRTNGKENYLTDSDTDNGSIQDINDAYISRSLRDKYSRACDLAIHIHHYNPVIKTQTDKGSYSSSLLSAYTACKNITDSRINNETIYVKSTLLQKGNKLLYDTVHSYIIDYFVKERLQALQQSIFDLKTFFFDVNKNVVELIEQCT